MAATSTRPPAARSCDACGGPIAEGGAASSGLLIRTRGDDVDREEPPLCERCALSIGMTFLVRLAAEEEEG